MSEESPACPAPTNAEPTATRSAAPMWIIVVTLTLLFFGFVFFDKHSGWFDSKIYAPYSSTEELDRWRPGQGPGAQGKKIYEAVCGICHGVDGMGKPGQAPPVAGSEWVVTKGINRLAHIPLAGVSGTLTVEGKEWNLNMAAMGAALSDTDLAAVLTYMRTAWGNKAGEVTADDIKKIRAEIKGAQPVTGDQLKAMPE
jgi:mono/diheme cytochrome c family protein